MNRRPRITLLATGLFKTMTGVERVVVETARVLDDAGISTVVYVDDDALWPAELPQGAVIRGLRRRPRFLVAHPEAALRALGRSEWIHSFGAMVLPSRTPVSYTLHDWGPWRDREIAWQYRWPWFVAQTTGLVFAKHVHVYSATVAEAAPAPWRSRMQPGRGLVVAAPLPPSVQPTSADLPGIIDRPFVLCVGSFDARKRLELLAAAAPLLGEGALLVLAGRGTESLHSPENQVIGLGSVEDSVLSSLYAEAKCFALISTYEGFGIPVLEARQYGLPVVLSEAVAALHPMQPNTWVLPEPASPDEIAGALMAALASPRRPPTVAPGRGLGHWLADRCRI